MKKVLAALAMILGISSSVAFAQEVDNSVVAESRVTQDEFVKMDPADLPQAVMQTLAKDYEGASIKEAYVKEKDGVKIYKIVVVAKDETETTIMLDEKGEAVKE